LPVPALSGILDDVLSEPEARQVAETALGEDLASRRVTITKVEEYDIGWAYYFQSTRYIADGDISDALVGNAPILVRRNDGHVLATDSGREIEFSIAVHERRQAWQDNASAGQRLLTVAIEELSVIGPHRQRLWPERLGHRFPEASEAILTESIEQATRIGELALELTRRPHDSAGVCSVLATSYPDLNTGIWPGLCLRAEYWWRWEI
jgi:hypothetical protein